MGGFDRTQDLQQSSMINNPKKILMDSLLCIYEVRNIKLHRQEFHSSYQTAVVLLEAFLTEIWELRLRDGFIQK